MGKSVENRRLSTARLGALAARQHEVFAVWQLKPTGVTDRAVQRRADAGLLRRLYHGVYTGVQAKLSLRGGWMAAVLACGPDALLSHRAAAALWDLHSVPSGPIDVTAPTMHRHPGVRSHTTNCPLGLIRATVDAIPVTTLERTVLDQARALGPQRLRTTLEQLQHRGLLSPARFDNHRFHRSFRAVSDAMAQLTDQAPWTQSELERRFLELIRDAGLPDPQTNVTVAGLVVDFCWLEQRLIVEIDGYAWHSSRRSFEVDRQRDVKLTLAGYRVIRITYARIVHDTARLLAELRGLIGSAAA
jgi:very-short-patch-repair endonuclease